MSPLRCSTVQEALWERAASAGPAPLTPAMADHLSECAGCQAEHRAVGELLEVTASIPDPPVPPDMWDDFDVELHERIGRASGEVRRGPWGRWTRRAAALAAMLVVGFGLGALTMRLSRPDPRAEAEARRAELIAQLGNDARLEGYLAEIEDLLVAYRATEHGEAVDAFRRSLPTAMVAGPGVPSELDRRQLEAQRATREQLRSLVLGMLATEIESESRGFAYLDRRIASVAGQQLLYFIR